MEKKPTENQYPAAVCQFRRLLELLFFKPSIITYHKLFFFFSSSQEEQSASVSGALLKPHLPSTPPDMSPFFLRQYVKGHAPDVFEGYPQLLTEMALRLPYQVQKHTPTHISFPQVGLLRFLSTMASVNLIFAGHYTHLYFIF